MTVTNKRIAIFREIGTLFMRNYTPQTKIHYAVKKMISKTESIHEAFVDSQESAKVDLAMTDKETKRLLRSGPGYEYTQENQKALIAKMRELANKTNTIDPHTVSNDDVPGDLGFQYQASGGAMLDLSDYDVRSAFTGFVIEEEV
jgi:hypothetical protein